MDMNHSCAGCKRREFLMQLGLLASAGAISGCGGLFSDDDLLLAIPPAVDAKAIPDKTGAAKVRVIFAYHKDDVQKRPDWPNVGFDFRPVMKNMIDTLNLRVDGVEFIPTHCIDQHDAGKLVDADEKQGEIQGYMFVQLNCWNTCIYAWNRTKKPVFYTPLPYAGDGGWLRHNSNLMNWQVPYCASFAALDFNKVVEVAKAFEVLKTLKGEAAGVAFRKQAMEIRKRLIPADTPPPGIKVLDDKVACRTPEAALAKLKGLKILSVERPADAKFAAEVKNTWGIEIIPVPFKVVNDACREADKAEAKRVFESWTKKAKKIASVTDETIFGCAKMYLGMRATLKKYGAHAITINCLGGCYSNKLDAYPCLGFMQLQDDGLMGVCEDDLRATISMMIGSALANDRVGYVSDPVLDMPNRAISYAHCVSTRRFFGPQGPESDFEILTHSEDRKGASVRAFAPIGNPVTTILVNPGSKQIVLHTGVVTANDRDDRACRTKIVARVTGDYSKIEHTWISKGWHRVTFMGDFREGIETLAKKVGYTIDYES